MGVKKSDIVGKFPSVKTVGTSALRVAIDREPALLLARPANCTQSAKSLTRLCLHVRLTIGR